MAPRFGSMAQAARIEARMTVRELARQLSWSPSYVSDVENGLRNPPGPEKVLKWAEILGADTNQFMKIALETRETLELQVTGESDLDLASALARKWPGLTDNQKKMMKTVLEEVE